MWGRKRGVDNSIAFCIVAIQFYVTPNVQLDAVRAAPAPRTGRIWEACRYWETTLPSAPRLYLLSCDTREVQHRIEPESHPVKHWDNRLEPGQPRIAHLEGRIGLSVAD